MQEAKLEGKAAAVEATNACLQRLYLPDMQYGDLQHLNPELTRASDTALRRASEVAYSRLQAAAASLGSCSDAIR